MKLLMILAMTALSTTMCQEIKGKGDIITKQMRVSATADEIEVNNAIKLTLSDKMPSGEISITTHENIHDYIVISNDSDELKIRLKRGVYKAPEIKVVASSKQYNKIEGSGAVKIVVEGATPSFRNYDIDLNGASTFRGTLDITDELELDISGASKVELSGSASRCEAELSGASSLNNTSFSCNDLNAEVSGASDIRISVNSTITGEVSGASRVVYEGSPRVSARISGASTVKPL